MENVINKKIRILFIEDQPERNRALQEILEDEYTVEKVGTAGKAFEKLRDNAYDLLILDIMIPVGNLQDYLRDVRPNTAGITILNWLRKSDDKLKTSQSVPVVTVSAIIEEDDIQFIKSILLTNIAQQRGFVVDELFFSKPYKIIAVKKVIDALLRDN